MYYAQRWEGNNAFKNCENYIYKFYCKGNVLMNPVVLQNAICTPLVSFLFCLYNHQFIVVPVIFISIIICYILELPKLSYYIMATCISESQLSVLLNSVCFYPSNLSLHVLLKLVVLLFSKPCSFCSGVKAE